MGRPQCGFGIGPLLCYILRYRRVIQWTHVDEHRPLMYVTVVLIQNAGQEFGGTASTVVAHDGRRRPGTIAGIEKAHDGVTRDGHVVFGNSQVAHKSGHMKATTGGTVTFNVVVHSR